MYIITDKPRYIDTHRDMSFVKRNFIVLYNTATGKEI